MEGVPEGADGYVGSVPGEAGMVVAVEADRSGWELELEAALDGRCVVGYRDLGDELLDYGINRIQVNVYGDRAYTTKMGWCGVGGSSSSSGQRQVIGAGGLVALAEDIGERIAVGLHRELRQLYRDLEGSDEEEVWRRVMVVLMSTGKVLAVEEADGGRVVTLRCGIG